MWKTTASKLRPLVSVLAVSLAWCTAPSIAGDRDDGKDPDAVRRIAEPEGPSDDDCVGGNSARGERASRVLPPSSRQGSLRGGDVRRRGSG